MLTTKPEVLEPHARHIGSAMLVINADSSWSIGTTMANAVKIQYDSFSSLDDATFGWSAVAAESNNAGGYRLFVRDDADEDSIIEVRVDASGRVDPASLVQLSAEQMFNVEEQYNIDLNGSGGFGSGPVLLQGGAFNLYMSELGHYMIGDSVDTVKTLTLQGVALDDELLPEGWEIIELTSLTGGGWNVFAEDPTGVIFSALFDSNGAYSGGEVLAGDALDAIEQSLGLDIDGDNDLPAPAGWTAAIVSPSLRAAIDKATSATTSATGQSGTAGASNATPQDIVPATALTHAELVGLFTGLIAEHKANDNAPITAQEIADLQAMAARGKALFAGNGPAAEYLSYVLGKMVEGSSANRFFNGGSTERKELGSLGANSPIEVLEKLVDKWLLGGDAPSPATAGDTATGAAKSVVAAYAKSSGELFVDGISVSDVNQGTAGNCYLIAAIGGLAFSKPDALQALFVDNGEIAGARSWGVRFYDANGDAHWVTVNDMLPVSPDNTSTLAYAGSADKALNGEIWVPLLEKAYAQANALGILPRAESTGQNSFAAIEGGQGDPLGTLIPAKVIAFASPGTDFGNNGFLTTRVVDRTDPAAREQMTAELKAFVNAGKNIWLGVDKTLKDAFGNQLLVASHAHFIVDADPADPDNSTVLVYNPWGVSPLPTPPGPNDNEFVSPALFTLAELVGIPGLDFMVLDGPFG